MEGCRTGPWGVGEGGVCAEVAVIKTGMNTSIDLSTLGRRLAGESGTRSLMDDLGEVASAGGDIMNLGGGNPSLIPAAEKVFRAHMQAFMRRDGAFERAVGSYDGPAGDRELPERWPACCGESSDGS